MASSFPCACLDAPTAPWLSPSGKHLGRHPPLPKEFPSDVTPPVCCAPPNPRRAHEVPALCAAHSRGLRLLFATGIREFPHQISAQTKFLPTRQFRDPPGRN